MKNTKERKVKVDGNMKLYCGSLKNH